MRSIVPEMMIGLSVAAQRAGVQEVQRTEDQRNARWDPDTYEYILAKFLEARLCMLLYMFLQVSLLAVKKLLCGEGALRARNITIAPWSRRAENISMT